jgi:hypothetical protein
MSVGACVQGHAACTIFYHRACLSRVEGTSLDQGLRQVLEATADALHPEVRKPTPSPGRHEHVQILRDWELECVA